MSRMPTSTLAGTHPSRLSERPTSCSVGAPLTRVTDLHGGSGRVRSRPDQPHLRGSVAAWPPLTARPVEPHESSSTTGTTLARQSATAGRGGTLEITPPGAALLRPNGPLLDEATRRTGQWPDSSLARGSPVSELASSDSGVGGVTAPPHRRLDGHARRLTPIHQALPPQHKEIRHFPTYPPSQEEAQRTWVFTSKRSSAR